MIKKVSCYICFAEKKRIDLKIVDPSGEVILGPSSPREKWSRDNRVLGRRSDLENGEMIFPGDVLVAHLVICLGESSGKARYMSRSWCRSKSDRYGCFIRFLFLRTPGRRSEAVRFTFCLGKLRRHLLSERKWSRCLFTS